MHTNLHRLSFAALFICFLALPLIAHAQDLKVLEKDAVSELRNAQNLFFSGKLNEADSCLLKAAEAIESLKKSAPAHAAVKSLEQKLARQRKELDLRKKKGQADSSQLSENARPETAKDGNASKVAQVPLPRKTAQAMREIERIFKSLETFEKDRLQRLRDGHDPERVDSIIGEIRQKLIQLNSLQQNVLAAAGEEKALEHPEIAGLQARVQRTLAQVDQEINVTSSAIANLASEKAAVGSASEALQQAFSSNDKEFFTPVHVLINDNNDESIEKAFNLLESFKPRKAELLSLLASFEEKYGSTRETIDARTGDSAHGHIWETLKKSLQEMDEAPKALAARIKAACERELAGLENSHDFYRLAAHTEINRLEALRQKHTPQEPGIQGLEKLLVADKAKFSAKIAERTMPESKGKSSDRDAALEYFKTTWGKDEKNNYEILGVVVTGDWSVQKKDITGKPVMYGLPLLLVVQKPEDKTEGLARVFVLTARTAESAEAKMEPPFTSETVGNSYFIKADKTR